ncbi:hypothetical protein HE1_00693 [Holospora elegans E1]|uniref:Uncharacterized protein n=1 Tax=Holospora elegans E1 TaxID=1427503 RepID=A0A023DY25_9PROT|nr:hypothetical protein HE1_00693 [Holospora elegans E1]
MLLNIYFDTFNTYALPPNLKTPSKNEYVRNNRFFVSVKEFYKRYATFFRPNLKQHRHGSCRPRQ